MDTNPIITDPVLATDGHFTPQFPCDFLPAYYQMTHRYSEDWYQVRTKNSFPKLSEKCEIDYVKNQIGRQHVHVFYSTLKVAKTK